MINIVCFKQLQFPEIQKPILSIYSGLIIYFELEFIFQQTVLFKLSEPIYRGHLSLLFLNTFFFFLGIK